MADQPKILIVEDEMIIAADMSMKLTKLGYSVIGIHTRAEDALKTVVQNPPDIVIMDILLSGDMNGINAAVQLYEKYKIPSIFLTSNTDDATFQKAKHAKPYAFISKPFRKDDLARAIDLALERILQEESLATIQNTETDFDQVSKLEDRLFIRHKDQMVMVPINDIIYLEAVRNYSRIITVEKEFLVTLHLGKIEGLFQKSDFVKVHRSYIVNLQRISMIHDRYEYLMLGKKQIPISRRMKKDLVNRVNTI